MDVSQLLAAADSLSASSPAMMFVAAVTVFVLATFVGFEVITKVPPTLHTPLMSGSNAISGITIIGAILVAGLKLKWYTSAFGVLAITFAMINVVGGFLVTHRMLGMFRRKG
jgi:NAD(P) transhydrogenase subunit alpha